VDEGAAKSRVGAWYTSASPLLVKDFPSNPQIPPPCKELSHPH